MDFWDGALAGLGIALPLGPIGVLILRTGLARGPRHGAAAGLGAATTDMLYAAVAVTVGTQVSALAGRHEGTIRAVAACVLIALGVALLVRSPGPAAGTAAVASRSAGRTWATFLGLTVVNPMTAVYFTSLALGLGGAPSASAAVWFVVAVGLGSFAWLAVVGVGSGLAGARMPDAARAWTARAGALVVIAFGIRSLLAVGA